MRKGLLPIACHLALTLAGVAAEAEVGVSIRIGEPGFYGVLELGDFPPPRLIYGTPRLVFRSPHPGRPLYLHVPPGHRRHWERHCAEYHACGHPVYFIDPRWYEEVYAPEYRARHGHGAQARGEPGHGGERHGGGPARDRKGGGKGKDEREGGGRRQGNRDD